MGFTLVRGSNSAIWTQYSKNYVLSKIRYRNRNILREIRCSGSCCGSLNTPCFPKNQGGVYGQHSMRALGTCRGFLGKKPSGQRLKQGINEKLPEVCPKHPRLKPRGTSRAVGLANRLRESLLPITPCLLSAEEILCCTQSLI